MIESNLLIVDELIDFGTNVIALISPGSCQECYRNVPVQRTLATSLRKNDIDVLLILDFEGDIVKIFHDTVGSQLSIAIIACPVSAFEMTRILDIIAESNLVVLGPESCGIMAPSRFMLGTIPGLALRDGEIGLVCTSGSLTYESMATMTEDGLGLSMIICVGTGAIIGTSICGALSCLEEDEETKKVVLIAEYNEIDTEFMVEFIHSHVSKPVVICRVGGSLPPLPDKMGHSSVILRKYHSATRSIIRLRENSCISFANSLSEIAVLLGS